MAVSLTRRITERTVLGALIAGFAIVLLMVGLAGTIAVDRARAIEFSTAQVVREQLLTARLLNEVQAEQNTLTAVLHKLSRTPDASDRRELVQQLEQTDQAINRIQLAARNTPEGRRWLELDKDVRAFSKTAREVLLNRRKLTAEPLAELFDRHDNVVRLVDELLSASSSRVAKAETQIEQQSHDLAGESTVLLGASLLMATFCAIGTVAFAIRGIRRLDAQANELASVSWHLLQGQETAARRFSHELHDELGQSLAAVRANLTAERAEELAVRRTDCIHLVDEAIANVRELSQLLRPVILDDFGLDASLRWLADKFAQRTRLDVIYESSLQTRLSDEVETHLYRIAQEALTNVARHSAASIVRIRLNAEGGEVRLCIEDNGRGIATNESSAPSLGMIGMRARARQAGGEMVLSKPTDGGLRIEVLVPLAKGTRNAERQEDKDFARR